MVRWLPRRLREIDAVLAATLALAFACCVHGITVRHMHPDQMAFVPLFHPDKWPFNPGWFEKPPFHTYVNYFLAVLPLSTLGGMLQVSPTTVRSIEIVWSRLLVTGMFLGSIALMFTIARRAFGRDAARVVAVLVGTSAGFVAHTHYLTADVPVTFWMLVALYFSHRLMTGGARSDYLFAGAFTGIATATKYNGLGIGIALVTAHVLRVALGPDPTHRWRRTLVSADLMLGLVMVGVGFVIANPFAVLDFPTFRDDFLYNYIVAPVYEGQTGHSWGQFFVALTEIVGLPGFVLAVAASAVAMSLIVRRDLPRLERATVWLCLCTFAVYYLKFAAFPRLETRFVLPIVPVWLLLSGPCWQRVGGSRAIVATVVLAVGVYNVACSAYVGSRFLADPRLRAATWVRTHVPAGSSIESDIYCPSWNGIGGGPLRQETTPFVTGRERLFERMFPGNAFVTGPDEIRQATDARVAWYTLAELAKRDPQLIAIDSLYYDRFVQPGMRSELYPSMRDYFRALLAEKYPYEIVYDRESPPVRFWAYPRRIDFLQNRITLLAKSGASPAARDAADGR